MTDSLAERLSLLLGAPAHGLERLAGGASREVWGFVSGDRELVVRRDPPGRPGSAGTMAREAAVIRACADAGLAVPRVWLFDEGDRLETAAIVMDRVPGETLARRILRDPEYSEARTVLTGQIGRFLAGLHAIDPSQVPEIDAVDPFDHYWSVYESVDDFSPTFEFAQRWLGRHRPAANDQRAIVHGDLRLGNLIVGPEGLRAVIDWEVVHLGDPIEDLAWPCVKAWRFGGSPEFAGIGSRDELITSYAVERGRPVDPFAFHWWLVQKTLQWGIVCMRQAAAHLTGLVASVELATIGRRVAEQEWDVLELLAPAACAAARREETIDSRVVDDFYGRPTADELLDAVTGFMTDVVQTQTQGQLAYHTRVAANALRIVQRELRLGEQHRVEFDAVLRQLGVTTRDELCRAIRAGVFDDREEQLHRLLASSVRNRLAVANPRHLNSRPPAQPSSS